MKNLYYNELYVDVCEASVLIKYFGQECLSNQFCKKNSACSRFTHYLCYLDASAWSRLRFLESMFVDPFGMTSGPGSRGVKNLVPCAMVLYTASDKIPPKYLYVLLPLLDGIYA